MKETIGERENGSTIPDATSNSSTNRLGRHSRLMTGMLAPALLLNLTVAGIYSVPLCAFVGAAATLVLVVYLSSSAGGANANNLILSGIIVAAILSAGISFLKFVADEQVSVIIFWLMGSFASKTWAGAGLTSTFLTGIGFAHPGKIIFDDLDLDLAAGRFTGLIGPNGCGKTTLLDLNCRHRIPHKRGLEGFGWYRFSPPQ